MHTCLPCPLHLGLTGGGVSVLVGGGARMLSATHSPTYSPAHHTAAATSLAHSPPQTAHLVLADGAAQHVARKGKHKVVWPGCQQVVHHRRVVII